MMNWDYLKNYLRGRNLFFYKFKHIVYKEEIEIAIL